MELSDPQKRMGEEKNGRRKESLPLPKGCERGEFWWGDTVVLAISESIAFL